VPDGLDETLWLFEADWLPVQVELADDTCDIDALGVKDWLGVEESNAPSDFVWLRVLSCDTDAVRDGVRLRLNVCVALYDDERLCVTLGDRV
jgi:hypothetical protein